MKEFLIKYRDFKVFIMARKDPHGYTPLSFDIYYLNQIINGSIAQKHITAIELAIDDYFRILNEDNNKH